MSPPRQQLRDRAKKLLALSQGGDGRLQAERVSAVLQVLRTKPPRHHRLLLREYEKQVERALRSEQAVVEFAGPEPSAEELQQVANALSQKTGRAVTPLARRNDALLAGLRVRLGDNVYDASAAGRLARLGAA